MLCLSVGQGVLFDLSTPGSYPIYMKDSMLNTNPSFDFGAFRALASRIKSNTSTVTAFAFSFTEPGTYVFGNSLNGATRTVVTVMRAGTTCPTEAAIMPLNEMNLIAVSARRRTDDIIMAPDWGLIGGILGGLVGMVVSVIAGMYYFRTKSWSASSFRKRAIGYRAASKAADLSTLHTKGAATAGNKDAESATSAQDGAAPALTSDDSKPGLLGSPRWSKQQTGQLPVDTRGVLHPWDEEDPDLSDLSDRLQSHHEAVTKLFDDQKGDVKTLLQHLQAAASELKEMIRASLETVSHTKDKEPAHVLDKNSQTDQAGALHVEGVETPASTHTALSISSGEQANLVNLASSHVLVRNDTRRAESTMIGDQLETTTVTERTPRTFDGLTPRDKLKAQAAKMQLLRQAILPLESEKAALELKFAQEEEDIENEYLEELKQLEEQFAFIDEEATGDESLPPPLADFPKEAPLETSPPEHLTNRPETASPPPRTSNLDLEFQLREELAAEMQAIDAELEREKQRVSDEIARQQQQLTSSLQETAQRNAHDLEQLLTDCQRAHEEESRNLKRSLDAERQRQERALHARMAKRREQREAAMAAGGGTPPDETGEAAVSAASVDDEQEKLRADAEMAAREALAWEELRCRQKDELAAITKQADDAAREKEEKAKMESETTENELDRLRKEHEEEMSRLMDRLDAEQRRQQVQLQQRIANRRARSHKPGDDPRSPLVSDERERADELALKLKLEAERERILEAERERHRIEEAELAARIAQAEAENAAVEAARKAMELAREAELDRVAKEFGDRSSELRQSQMADLASQKQKLEARVAAKRHKKMMELEAKKQLERQKLEEEQAQLALSLGAGDEAIFESVTDDTMTVPDVPDEASGDSKKLTETAAEEKRAERVASDGSMKMRRQDSALGDVRLAIELRLRNIEELLSKHECDCVDREEDRRSRYKIQVLQAIDNACRWCSMFVKGSESGQRVDFVRIKEGMVEIPHDGMDELLQHQVAFANTLLKMMALRESTGSSCDPLIVERIGVTNESSGHMSPVSAMTVYDPSNRLLCLRSESVGKLDGGQLALLLAIAVAEIQAGTSDVTDPQFIRCFYSLLVACYTSLFRRSVVEKAAPTAPAPVRSVPSLLLSSSTRRLSAQVVSAPEGKRPPSESWQARLHEMESFLSGFRDRDFGAMASGGGSLSPRSRAESKSMIRRQATAVMAVDAMARSSSRFLLTSKDGPSTEMEALMVQERRQFLQEKLDTAEKLYAHVLRQLQEQKQSVEYVQEMLAQEHEREAELTREDKAMYVDRLDALQDELHAAQAALEKTKREREELYTQCQSLRDELDQLPRSRPSTVGNDDPTLAQPK